MPAQVNPKGGGVSQFKAVCGSDEEGSIPLNECIVVGVNRPENRLVKPTPSSVG